jgi:hypothetical protein
MRSLDTIEAITNAVAGLAVSMVAVWALRASGAWVIATLFFGLSLTRARVLRFIFREVERAKS